MNGFTIFQDFKSCAIIAPVKLIGAFIIVFLLAVGCDKDDSPVPDVSFTAFIDINLPDYSGSVFTVRRDRDGNRVGILGVIVYRLSDREFYVFEQYCPFDKKITCSVTLGADKSTALCNCCGSEFLIISPGGDVVSGPSKWGLKRYSARFDGRYLVVSN